MLIVFFTALKVESEAVLAEIDHRAKRLHPDGTLYEVGRLRRNPAIEVAHVEIGQGVERTAQHVERAVSFLSPKAIIFVGVAGGIRDCGIGDVIVATKTYQYEYGVEAEKFKPRPQTYGPSHLLEQLARGRARTQPPNAQLGAVATGSKVVHSSASTVAQLIRESYSDALALEMEGHSFYAAVSAIPNLHALLVRAISDLLDGKADSDKAGGQVRASKAATEFAIGIAEDFWETLGASGPSVSPNRLPGDNSPVFGRAEVLSEMEDALTEDAINLLSIIAWAGTGKTALARVWCDKVKEIRLEPGAHVFTWSFYSQGADRMGTVNSDELFIALLEHAGIPDVAALSPWRRVELAVKFCREEQVLLVLDGLEPLQQAGDIERGHILDGPLRAFVEDLAAECRGLLIVTSRVSLIDVPNDERHRTVDLPHLEPDPAVQALEHYGMRSDREKLRDIAEAVDGHCLSLRLIARFFAVCEPEGPTDAAVDALRAISHPSAKVDRLLSWYEGFLAGTPQLDVLRSLGLFDRATPLKALCAVHVSPAVGALNPTTALLATREIGYAVRELADLGLTQVEGEGEEVMIDAHPLIRETFGRRLSQSDPAAWSSGHRRLFEHFDNVVDRPAETVSDLSILYLAVHHAVLAGDGARAVTEVLRPKVQQGERSFASKRLQLASADLAALAPFFSDWSTMAIEVDDRDAMWLMSHALYDLRVLGHIPLSLELCLSLRDRLGVSGDTPQECVTAANASHLSLIAGRISDAVEFAEDAFKIAGGLPASAAESFAARRSLSNALMHLGDLAAAEALTKMDKPIGNQVDAAYPAFLSPVGFRYGLLLIAINELRLLGEEEEEAQRSLRAAIDRFATASALDEERGYGLAQGLATLVFARLLSLGVEAGIEPLQNPVPLANEAEDYLRTAATQDLVVCSLILSSRVHLVAGDPAESRRKLSRALEMSQRFGFPLYETSALVEDGIRWLSLNEHQRAEEQWQEARDRAGSLQFGLELARLSALRA